MDIIIHRVNAIAQLKEVPNHYGVEIDVRGYGDKLYLTHDPIKDNGTYDELECYLQRFKHSMIVFNMKEAGYEGRVIELAKKYNVKKYFLLDVEFPYLYQATRNKGIRDIAVRYSEAEPIEFTLAQVQDGRPLLDWVWIDTNTCLPLDDNIVATLKNFKTCLVCPERWGRPEDIDLYINKIKELNFSLTAVMTARKYASQWEKL